MAKYFTGKLRKARIVAMKDRKATLVDEQSKERLNVVYRSKARAAWEPAKPMARHHQRRTGVSLKTEWRWLGQAPQQRRRDVMAPYPVFEGWDEAMPARIGTRSLELPVHVLPDKLAAMVFPSPMSLMVRTASD